jgi:two-component system aerobic respiration control sensor histidine kinase ArcB
MARPRQYILVVEDDEDLREVLVEVLGEHGYVVLAASNGREALALLEAEAPPCLVLLDQSMPVMSGEELRQTLATMPSLADVPVCVLTGDVRYAGNGVEVIKKPIDEDAMLEVIRRHCGTPSPAQATPR